MKAESLPRLMLTFLLVASMWASPTHAGDAKVAFYPVEGKTAKEIYDFIRYKVPRVAGNATFAYTVIATKSDQHTKQGAQGCHYTAFKTSGFYIYNLPLHTKPETMNAGTRHMWLAFVQYLKQHETLHRASWKTCFAQYDSQVLDLEAKDCKALDKQREKTFTKVKRDCLKQDEALDVEFRKAVLDEPFVAAALAKKAD